MEEQQMEISYPECEQIVKTLSIGYYAKRRIPISMDKDAECSYYSPMEDTIGISYNQIAQGLKALPETDSKESAVRASFYHEVSHAILTPKNITINERNNIFEDERIETIFKDFYLDVDFKKNILAINGGKIHTPMDATQAFYNVVRYRVGPEKFLKRVEEIINDYSSLNRTSQWSWCWSYENAIEQLFRDIAKDYPSHPEDYTPKAGEGKEDGESSDGQSNDRNGDLKQSDKGDAESESNSGNSGNDDMEGTGTPAHGSSGFPIKEAEKLFRKAMSAQYDDSKRAEYEEARKLFETVISNFNKKNKGGSGINTYSGVFNPRAVVRQDYRYFERSISNHGNNRFGTFHMNLYIDESGSFWGSQNVVNELLRILTDVEKRYSNFKLDVYFVGMGMRKANSIRERELNCSGGNRLDDDVIPMIAKAQDRDTYNYNIVLFDGDAFSDSRYDKAHRRKVFKRFDMQNATMITDVGNHEYIDKNFTSAKVIYTDNYTDELLKNIETAFTTAFK